MSKAAVANDPGLDVRRVRKCCSGNENALAGESVNAPQAKFRASVAARRVLPYAMTLAASILLLASLRLPLWRMHLEAPQYRDKEALNVAVHPDRLAGDLRELTTLDQYIGVHVPKTLPQFKWMPGLIASGAIFGIVALLLPAVWRRFVLAGITISLATGLAISAFQATNQIRDIGHKRDQKTVLAGIKDFTPPFLGTSKIAQFTVSSWFGIGAWLIGGSLALQVVAAWLSGSKTPRCDAAQPSKFHEEESLVSSTPN